MTQTLHIETEEREAKKHVLMYLLCCSCPTSTTVCTVGIHAESEHLVLHTIICEGEISANFARYMYVCTCSRRLIHSTFVRI